MSNIKISKDGYVKQIKHPMTDKIMKSIKVDGNEYRFNSVYKTYNSVKGNELLHKNDINKIRYESKMKKSELRQMIREEIKREEIKRLNEAKLKNVKTKEDARQQALDWQHDFSNKSMSWADTIEAANHFEKMGKKFNLTKEFEENGII